MIAKVRVLGLRAADARALRAAGNRILEYLQGGPAEPAAHGDFATVGDGAGLDDLGGASGGAGAVLPLSSLAGYYEAGPDGRSRGRARGAGAPALGLVGAVTAEQLVRVLTGLHPLTGERVIGARGSSGRAVDAPKGSRVAARHGLPDETLSLPEAAFVAGVVPGYLRHLVEHQPRTRFETPTPTSDLDPRVARRLLEALTGRPVQVAGADNDFLVADKERASGEWRIRRAELERYMAERTVPETVMGFDVVCAAPKSVSLLWAVGDARVRTDIAEAFDAAVDALVSYLEAHACFGMVDGRNQPGDGLAVVSYVHDTSRSSDAHLHTHNIVANMVRVTVRHADGRPVTDADGQPRVEWRTLDSGSLLRHVKTAGYVGAAELRSQLATRWGVQWNTVRSGVAEIAGFPPELIRAFSTRHDQIAEEFAQLVESGFEPDGATEVAAQRTSRAPKTVLADEEVRAVQAAKLAGVGWTPARVLDLIDVGPRTVEPVSDAEVAELADRLVGPSGLTDRQTTFGLRDVHQAVAGWAADRLTATQVRDVAEGFLGDHRVVACGAGERVRTRQDPDPVFTTESLLAAEDNLQTLFRHGRTDHGGAPTVTLAGPAVDAAIAAVNVRLAVERDDPGARLSDEQAGMVGDVLVSADLIRCVLGPAGTGKTEAMRAAVAAWRAAGFGVLGSANGGAQTEALGARLGVDARVVRSWLTRLETADDPVRVWAPNTVLIVDEATQVATRDAEKLARWAIRTHTVVVFVGDPAQLGSVGAGGWFAHLVSAHGAPSLSAVYRQSGADMAEVRAALSGLRSDMPGRVRTAMDRLAADGRIKISDNPDALLAQVVEDWYADRHHRLAATGGRIPKPSQMMAAHHREVDTLNSLARRRLVADGTVTGPEVVVGERRFGVGDEVVTLTQAGHTLIPAGASRDRYIRTGTIGTVTDVHVDAARPDAQHLLVAFGGRGTVRVGWAYLSHDFDDGRSGGLAHAYAITADRSQGSTMHAARAVGTDTTSRAAFYVMVSRGERDVAAYLVADRDLAHNADDEQWLPVLRHPGGPFDAVVEHLERSRPERLATDVDPVAFDAQALRRGRTLAELAAVRHVTETNPSLVGDGAGVTFVVARRAELAEQAAIGARALSAPRPELVARLGHRPTGGHQQRTWDQAVRSTAVFQARWETGPGRPGYGHGAGWAIGPRPADERSAWAQQRARAELIVTRWAATLDTAHQHRFWEIIEHIPRDRATAGIHALLAAGVPTEAIHAALAAREQSTARAGAAVLEHRVNKLLSAHNVDAAGHRLPPPLTAAVEWDQAARLLAVAEANQLSRQPVAVLAAERRELAQLLTGADLTFDPVRVRADVAAVQADHDQAAAHATAARHNLDTETAKRRPDRSAVTRLRNTLEMWEHRQAGHAQNLSLFVDRLRAATGAADAQRPLRERHQVLTAALDLLVDHAMTQAGTQPPDYLTDLLGERPADPDQRRDWETRARHVEVWRHHTIGLPYGQTGTNPSAPASERALGPVPDNPTLAAQRTRVLDHSQATLDLGVGR